MTFFSDSSVFRRTLWQGRNNPTVSSFQTELWDLDSGFLRKTVT